MFVYLDALFLYIYISIYIYIFVREFFLVPTSQERSIKDPFLVINEKLYQLKNIQCRFKIVLVIVLLLAYGVSHARWYNGGNSLVEVF